MKNILSLLLSLPLLLSTAFAGDFSNFNFGFDWSGGGNRVASFYSPFTSTLSVLAPPRSFPGTAGTFTRASAQTVPDHEGVYRTVASGSVGITGSRIVTNLLTYSEDLSNAAWAKEGTGTITGTNILNMPAANDGMSQAKTTGQGTVTARVLASGNGTTVIALRDFYGTWLVQKTVTLTSTPQIFSVTGTVASGATTTFYVRRLNGTTATQATVNFAQLENVTAQSNTNPGEYVPTTTAPVSKCFSTTNGNTVNGTTGVVTEATGTPLTTVKGPLLETASTNKVTAYSFPQADTLGSELITVEADRTFASDTEWWTRPDSAVTISAGTANFSNLTSTGASIYRPNLLTAGKIYAVTFTITGYGGGSIVIRNGGLDHTSSHAANGTYTDYVLQGTTGGTAGWKPTGFTGSIDNISIKEVTWAVGTKSYWTGAAFQNNITGLTLSGDTAAVLSIVTDTAEITAAGLLGINPGAKVYKLDNSGGSLTSYATAGGTAGNLNAHSTLFIIRNITGTTNKCGANYTSATATTIPSSAYTSVKLQNYTPTNTLSAAQVAATAGGVLYFLAPQLEEQSAATSVILVSGATATRAQTVLSYPISGNFGIPASVKFDWTPETSNVASERFLLGSYVDASNYFGILHDGTNLVFRKRIGGSNFDAVKALTPVAGTTYSIGARLNADYSHDVFVSSVKGTGNTGLSNEKVVNGGFADGSSWALTGEASISGGQARLLSSAGALSQIETTGYTPMVIGRTYQVTYTIVSASGAGMNNGGTTTWPIVVGANTVTYVAPTTALIFKRAGTTDIVFDNVSVKEVSLAAPAATTTFSLGNLNGANGVISSEIKNLKIYKRKLPDSLMFLDWKYRTSDSYLEVAA